MTAPAISAQSPCRQAGTHPFSSCQSADAFRGGRGGTEGVQRHRTPAFVVAQAFTESRKERRQNGLSFTTKLTRNPTATTVPAKNVVSVERTGSQKT